MAGEFRSRVIKAQAVDADLGLVLGWGIICSEGGEPYYDLQNQHIPADLMVKATTDFMAEVRATDEMHDEEPDGTVVHSFPLTEAVKAAFGIECDREGWMIAMRPSPPVLQKFVSGEYTGFSIGGRYAAEAAA